MTELITRHRKSHWRALAALCAAAVLAVVAMPGRTADDALYGPEAPPGSAFIRVFNATDQVDLNVQVGDKTVSGVDAWEVSDFEFLAPGTHRLDAGTAATTVTLQPSRFYTAVVSAQGVRLLDNPPYQNRLKALVMFYNLTDADGLGLRTADGRTAVIDGVARNASGTREVNPAREPLALFKGEQRIADAPQQSFTRGKAYSLFAIGSADTPRLVWAVN